MRRSLHTALLTLSLLALTGPVARDRRQGHHQRGLLPDRVLPAVRLHDEPPPELPGQAEGSPQGGREGPPRPRRPARRLVATEWAGPAFFTSAAGPRRCSRSTAPSAATRSTAPLPRRCWRPSRPSART